MINANDITTFNYCQFFKDGKLWLEVDRLALEAQMKAEVKAALGGNDADVWFIPNPPQEPQKIEL